LIDKLHFVGHDPTVDVNKALDAYLCGELSLEELRNGLMVLTLEGGHASPLAHAIEYFMDEVASNAMTFAELDQELTALAKQYARVPA
jgi:hypothetical protein